MEASRQKAKRVNILDHKAIMEEAERCNRLDYDDGDNEESNKEELECKVESDGYE